MDLPNLEYIFDPVELDLDYWQYLYYFIYQPVQTFIYNQGYKNRNYTRQFKKNMERAIERYSVGLKDKVITETRQKMVELEKIIEKNPPQIYDEKLDKIKYYHVKYYWQAENSKNTCDICKARNGKRLINIKDLKTHWNCKCTILQYSWYEDDEKNIFDEKIKIL